MASSTQRLLLLVLVINLMFSMSIAIYEAPRVADYGVFTEITEVGLDTSDRVENESAITAPSSLNEESTFGSAIRMGLTVLKILLRGLNPFPTSLDATEDPLTDLVGYTFMIFRLLFIVLLAIEIYLVIKNRKN
jgi:hypothetical protein